MLAIVAEVVIRWAGTVVRSSSWFAVWSNWCLVWSGDWLAVGSRVVRASKFAVAWASKGAVRSSIELTVTVVSGLSEVSQWELGMMSSWLVVMDDFLGVMGG